MSPSGSDDAEELRALGGADLERALERLRTGAVVTYRGMTLVLRQTEFECRVPAPDAAERITDHRALDLLTRARYRLGAMLVGAPPIAALAGNREPRFVLVSDAADADLVELYELRGDRLRRLGGAA